MWVRRFLSLKGLDTVWGTAPQAERSVHAQFTLPKMVHEDENDIRLRPCIGELRLTWVSERGDKNHPCTVESFHPYSLLMRRRRRKELEVGNAEDEDLA